MRIFTIQLYAKEHIIKLKTVKQMCKNKELYLSKIAGYTNDFIIVDDGIPNIFLKKCTNCQELKELNKSNFTTRKNKAKNGMTFMPDNVCILCNKNKRAKYVENNKDKISELKKAYISRDYVKNKRKIYLEKHREERKQYKREYRKNNREKIRLAKQIYREKNLDKERDRARKYREKNKEKIKIADRAHYFRTKEAHRASSKKTQQKRLANDPIFRLKRNVSTSILSWEREPRHSCRG